LDVQDKQMTLFCLPYAGGSKYSYREFERVAPSFLKIVTMEYPGRGGRSEERLCTSIPDLLEDLYEQILPSLSAGSYALYGHSMGGLIAYLLTQKIVRHGETEPQHLFVTGTRGPLSQSNDDRKIYRLNEKDFVEELRKLKGCPEEILNDPDVFEYFAPILRADFQAIETFKYNASAPVPVAMTVITGTEEDLDEDDILQWRFETSSTLVFKKFPGHHFFIFQYPLEIIRLVAHTLFYKNAIDI